VKLQPSYSPRKAHEAPKTRSSEGGSRPARFSENEKFENSRSRARRCIGSCPSPPAPARQWKLEPALPTLSVSLLGASSVTRDREDSFSSACPSRGKFSIVSCVRVIHHYRYTARRITKVPAIYSALSTPRKVSRYCLPSRGERIAISPPEDTRRAKRSKRQCTRSTSNGRLQKIKRKRERGASR